MGERSIFYTTFLNNLFLLYFFFLSFCEIVSTTISQERVSGVGKKFRGLLGDAQQGRNEGWNYRRQSTVCSVINSIINSLHDEWMNRHARLSFCRLVPLSPPLVTHPSSFAGRERDFYRSSTRRKEPRKGEPCSLFILDVVRNPYLYTDTFN